MIKSRAKQPKVPEGIRTYLERQSGSRSYYLWEHLLQIVFGWVPTVAGIGFRAVAYKLIVQTEGWAAVENRVRLRFARNIHLGDRTYLDQNTYLHACPNGIEIGDRSLVMYGSILHVYNFRGLPNAGIRIGCDSLIGEYNVIRGQGGVTIGDRVYTSPFVQIIAVNHVFDDVSVPFTNQGITARGIVVEDDVWIGSGAVLTDGIHVGSKSVIAAGSVVVKDVPASMVVGGVPAQPIRRVGDRETPKQDVYF